MRLQIRLASPSDAPAIASIHVRCWQSAYRGIVPTAVLDSLSVAAHEQLWRHSLGSEAPQPRVWIAEEDGTAAGFCATGPSSDDDTTAANAEVGAIYLEPVRIGTGVGRALFRHAVNDLRDRGFRTATLWVFHDNTRARRFYEAAGWEPDGKMRSTQRGDIQTAEIRYRRELAASQL